MTAIPLGPESLNVDWDDHEVNVHPFVTCPVCRGHVEPVSYLPLMKTCLECEKTWLIYTPLPFRSQAHNEADAIAFGLYQDGLPWSSVGIIMRTRHNVELTVDGWRTRINDRYKQRGRRARG